MTTYDDAQDGLYISTVESVYDIPAVRGSIFAAEGGDWEDGTRTLWPTGQQDQTWGLDEQFETEEVLPLTRPLVLEYLRQRDEHHPVERGVEVGHLVVNVSDGSRSPGERGRLDVVVRADHSATPLAIGWEQGRTRGWNYEGWEVIRPSEAGALASFAARWWENGGEAPERVPVGDPVSDEQVTDRGARRIQVARTWQEPDESAAEVRDVIDDGVLVRTVRVPLVERSEDALYVESAWVEDTVRHAGAKHGRSSSVRELLSGHEYTGGGRTLSWRTCRRVVWGGREYVSVPDLSVLVTLATERHGWCSTARTVLRAIEQGDVGPTWTMRVSMTAPEPTPAWMSGAPYFEASLVVPGADRVDAEREGLRLIAEWLGTSADRLSVPTPASQVEPF